MKPENHAQQQARAQYESIVAMLAAVSVDYDRLEELRELAKTPRFIAGWNNPGYVPDNPPAAFDSADDALEYIRESARETADDDGAADVISTWRADESGEFGATFGTYHYFVSRDGFMINESEDDARELQELQDAAGDCESEDDARDRINEDPLEITVRASWHNPGENPQPDEFCILLTTGGPAVRIIGELNEHAEPISARMQYQDWFTPWENFTDAESDVLCEYARNFYFGE